MQKAPAGYVACRTPCSPPLASGHLRHPGARSLPPAERCVISLARSQPAALRTQKTVPPFVPGFGGGGRASLCCPSCAGVSALCLCTRTLRAEKEHPYCSRVSSGGSLKIQARSSPVRCTPMSEERQGDRGTGRHTDLLNSEGRVVSTGKLCHRAAGHCLHQVVVLGTQGIFRARFWLRGFVLVSSLCGCPRPLTQLFLLMCHHCCWLLLTCSPPADQIVLRGILG